MKIAQMLRNATQEINIEQIIMQILDAGGLSDATRQTLRQLVQRPQEPALGFSEGAKPPARKGTAKRNKKEGGADGQ